MNPINARIFAVKVKLFPFSGEEGKMTIKFTLFDSVRRPRYSKDLIFPPLAKQGRESFLLSSVLLSQKQRKRLVSPTSALDQYQMSTKMPMETKLAASSINSPQPEQLFLSSSFPSFPWLGTPSNWLAPLKTQAMFLFLLIFTHTALHAPDDKTQLSHTTQQSHTQTLGPEPGL